LGNRVLWILETAPEFNLHSRKRYRICLVRFPIDIDTVATIESVCSMRSIQCFTTPICCATWINATTVF
jgi:hypothetical protein